MGGRGLSGERWGILGGTFDPVHYAHLAIAEQVREALLLAGVLFVPAREPVHKPGIVVSPVHDRVAMLELATAGNPAFTVSRIELERSTASWSVDTLEQLTAERPEDEFFFILSVEAAGQLHTWHRPQRLLELCRLAVVPRLGYEVPSAEYLAEHFAGLEERVVSVPTSRLGHSASDIRARVAAGRTIRYLVPSAVNAYIKEHALYRADD
jgi:nicotinate-nucleotide adenylyltransferase